jgi:hypothetical protein
LIWRVEQWTWKERKKQSQKLHVGSGMTVISGEKYDHLAAPKYGDSGRSTNFIRKFDPYKDLQESNMISTGNIPSGEGLSKLELLPAGAAHMTEKGRAIRSTSRKS